MSNTDRAGLPGWAEYADTLDRLRRSNSITEATCRELHNAARRLAMIAWETGADDMAEAAASLSASPTTEEKG